MKKMKPWMKIVLSVFVIIVLVGGAVFSYTFYQLSKMNTSKISKTDADLGIKPEVSVKKENEKGIINIALFGLDREDKNQPSRSDSIIMLSIDGVQKKIKMSSIMRDTYVGISGHDKTKLAHAYAYGGPQLAIKTLNENFNLDIRDYVSVDFIAFEKIIDDIGTINIDIKQDEISAINDKILEASKIEKKAVTKITKSGLQTLNGLQAVAYSRVRYTTGGDFRRTERQRKVLSAVLTKIKSLGVTESLSVATKILPYTETNMNNMKIIKNAKEMVTFNIKSLEQERFPVDGYCSGKTIDGVWYLVADMSATMDQIHKFIYKDIKPVPKAPL
ncbi:LCP family protein [Clostridium tagluense]|uniref:LCP family protein n=1 Tax=Clostridium tagluense TaxID=360422 RepID=UPI001CF40699|nr:LCP family protein [Clostridium tagluense]MCB2298264.1 LCP family protein [Clostridium tagluense]